MADKFTDRLIQSIQGAALFDNNNMVRPEVILWCDPESQWQSIIETLQQQMPYLLVFGNYNAGKKTGPAIWLKCMVPKVLPEANWTDRQTPIIYFPGIAKQDLKNLSNARPDLMPLMEYQYTGVFWQHRNGKEWTVNAFMMDTEAGLGLKVQQDHATREATIKALPQIAENEFTYPSHINSEFLYSLIFPNQEMCILKWMDEKDNYINSLKNGERAVFTGICQSRYDFLPNAKNIKDIVEKFAARKNNWQKVWDTFAASPQKFPGIKELLHQFCPSGPDRFLFPEESFPQINDDQEETLRKTFEGLAHLSMEEAAKKILELEKYHAQRRNWVWAEMGKTSLAKALQHLSILAQVTSEIIPTGSLSEITSFYESKGHKADYAALKALSFGISIVNKEALTVAINKLYSAWLENLAAKFQSLIQKDATVFTTNAPAEMNDEFILFVDAFRYDLASAFTESYLNKNHKATLAYGWSALPSLTPTAKPAVSPVAKSLNTSSDCHEFRPQTISGKELLHPTFKTELQNLGYKFISNFKEIEVGKKHWMEIGNIDKTGHTEQSGIVKRIDELFNLISETIETVFEKGIRKIKIVTDHGWLMLAGGLPKTELPAYLTETRWGRCALMKEGVKSELLHLPWRWNKHLLIAYAPGISFFKKNEEYAHGGVSLQECFVPLLTIENGKQQSRTIIVNIKWTHLKCSLEITGAGATCKVMIRTKHSDPASFVSKEKNVSHDGRVTLFVEDADYESQSAFVVITEADGTVIHKQQTIIGE